MPSSSYVWAKGFNKKTLDQHYNDHAQSMGIKTKESYAAHAIKFANTVDRTSCVSFIDAKMKATYKYNKVTNEFAIITQNGCVATYYKPSKGQAYYESEKAKRIKGGKKNEEIQIHGLPRLQPVPLLRAKQVPQSRGN